MSPHVDQRTRSCVHGQRPSRVGPAQQGRANTEAIRPWGRDISDGGNAETVVADGFFDSLQGTFYQNQRQHYRPGLSPILCTRSHYVLSLADALPHGLDLTTIWRPALGRWTR
jgi:hypothetical protein